MALPLDQAIPRFKENEERIDTWVNDVDNLGFYVASDYENVETIPAFMARKDTELNAAVADATADAEAAAAAAAGSASDALTSANNANTSETNAAGFATAASNSAAAALTSRNQAQTFANTASAQATAASGHATTATNAANTASGHATTASTQAGIATTAASNAQTYRDDASGFADAASASADDAAASAEDAGEFATAANGFATTAGSNATAAAGHATNAENYRNQAETYATAADSSEDNASIAATSALAAAVQAQQYFEALSGLNSFTGLYTNYYDFNEELPTLADGTYAIAADENFPGNPFSIYTVETSVATFVTSLIDGGSFVNWGAIGGTLSDQTDLQVVLTDYNDRIVDLEYGLGTASWGSIVGTLSDQTDLNSVLTDLNDRVVDLEYAGPTSVVWGDITGVLSDQTDLQSVISGLDTRIDDLESAPPGSTAWGAITGTLSSQTDLQTALDTKIESSDLTAPNITYTPASSSDWPGTDPDDVKEALDKLAARPTSIITAITDITSVITVGTNKMKIRMPYAMTLTEVRASLFTGQTGSGAGGLMTFDINEGGSSILSTKLTIDNGESTSTTAATPAVISDASLANDAEISFDVDQVGDGTARGAIIYLIGYPT